MVPSVRCLFVSLRIRVWGQPWITCSNFWGIFDPLPPSRLFIINKVYVIKCCFANPSPSIISTWFMDDSCVCMCSASPPRREIHDEFFYLITLEYLPPPLATMFLHSFSCICQLLCRFNIKLCSLILAKVKCTAIENKRV